MDLAGGVVVLTLVAAVGMFVYFSPGQEETWELLNEVKLHTQGWKDEELRDVLVQMQRMIRESHPRLRRFRVMYVEDGRSTLPPLGTKISWAPLDESIINCLRYVTELSDRRYCQHAGGIIVTRVHDNPPPDTMGSFTFNDANPEDIPQSYLESYVWPGRPPGVDAVR
jgi:hypothetical protein